MRKKVRSTHSVCVHRNDEERCMMMHVYVRVCVCEMLVDAPAASASAMQCQASNVSALCTVSSTNTLYFRTLKSNSCLLEWNLHTQQKLNTKRYFYTKLQNWAAKEENPTPPRTSAHARRLGPPPSSQMCPDPTRSGDEGLPHSPHFWSNSTRYSYS